MVHFLTVNTVCAAAETVEVILKKLPLRLGLFRLREAHRKVCIKN